MEEYGIKNFETENIGGKIKTYPEDFIVEEIWPGNKIYTVGYNFIESLKDALPKSRKEYLHLTLVKRNYTTERAISRLSHALHISKTRFGFAGTKDKRALTSQRISIWNIDLEKVKKIRIKDIFLKNFEYSDKRISLGDLLYNKFTITIRDIKCQNVKEKIQHFLTQINKGIPNFFGPQRFGIQRAVNHLIGKQILLGNFEGAAMIFLTAQGKENAKAASARQFAAQNWGNWKEILKIWPKNLGLEAAVLNYLLKYPSDYANGLRKLPKHIRKMFIHSFQSFVFNKTLSEILGRGIPIPEQIPLVGYNTVLEGEVGKIISKILKEEQVKLEHFKLKSMPELAEPGSMRNCLVFPKDFKILKIKDNLLKIEFKLDKGSYATVVLLALLGEYVE